MAASDWTNGGEHSLMKKSNCNKHMMVSETESTETYLFPRDSVAASQRADSEMARVCTSGNGLYRNPFHMAGFYSSDRFVDTKQRSLQCMKPTLIQLLRE